jgi:hypothetical protein
VLLAADPEFMRVDLNRIAETLRICSKRVDVFFNINDKSGAARGCQSIGDIVFELR